MTDNPLDNTFPIPDGREDQSQQEAANAPLPVPDTGAEELALHTPLVADIVFDDEHADESAGEPECSNPQNDDIAGADILRNEGSGNIAHVAHELPAMTDAEDEGVAGSKGEHEDDTNGEYDGEPNALLYPLSTNAASQLGDDLRAYPLPRMVAQRPSRPVAPPVNFEGLADNLPQGRHFLLWRYEWVENKGQAKGDTKDVKPTGDAPIGGSNEPDKSTPPGKYTKVPYHRNGYRIDITNKAALLTLAEVKEAYLAGLTSPDPKRRFDGIGLVLDLELGIAALDLDHQRDENGQWSEAARSIIASVNSYSEISPSGNGIRIIAFAKLLTDEVKNGDFENFQTKHYVTLTGLHIPGTPQSIEHRQEEVAAYHTKYVVKARKARPRRAMPDAAAANTLTKEQILEKGARAHNGAKFIDFYRQGPASPLAPKKGDGSADWSVMDIFVCGVLAKFSGGNAPLMDEMMRESALMRDKWDKRIADSTYGERTIKSAIAGCREFFDPLAPEFEELAEKDIPKAKGTGKNGVPAYGPRQILELLYPDWDVAAIDTEAAHARRIEHYLAGELCHVDGLGWLKYNGRHWEVDSKCNKRTLARVAELSKYVHDEATRLYELSAVLSGAAREGDAIAMSDAAKSLSGLARKVESKRFIADSVELTAGRPRISRHMREFEPKEWLIPVSNGVWDAGEFREHRAEDCVLQLCPVEVDFERLAELEAQIAQLQSTNDGEGDAKGEAQADIALGPWRGTEWGRVLDRITGGDADLARTLQEVAAYALSAAPYLRTILWAYGERGTGKGTFTELLKTVMGENAVTLDPRSLSPRGDRQRLGSQLAQKRLGLCPEAGHKQFDAELLKTLSGADTMGARRLYNEPFDAEPHHVLFLVSNDAPRLESSDPALKERLLVLPFLHAMGGEGQMELTGGKRLEQVRRQADSPLVREFFLWALVGARRVMENGQIHRAAVIQEATDKFWADTDTMRRFWETVPLDKLDRGLFQGDMRTLYHSWCEGLHIPPQYRLRDASFRRAVESMGLEEVRLTRDNVRSWKLPKDPGRVCSRLVTEPQTGRQVVTKLNIFGEEVVNGDSGSHPVFDDNMYKEADFGVESGDGIGTDNGVGNLSDLLPRLNIPAAEWAAAQGVTRNGGGNGGENGSH